MSDLEPLRITVPKRLSGTRFDRALAELVPGRSRSQLQKLVRRGLVEVNGRKVLRSNFSLRGGEEILLRPGEAAAPSASLDLLHVEEDFAVVNKPPGMLAHPTPTHVGGTVAELAVERFGPLPSADETPRPGVVHRLDRETSGVMLIARTAEALHDLRRQFRERTVDKRYLAVVHGVPPEESFRVDAALATARGQKDLQRIDPRGRSAESEFRVVRRWERFALVECRPHTGRRHQLRVHLHSVGHPVVGDELYRPATKPAGPRGPGHHALHAASLAVDHPRDGRRLEFHAPLPDSLATFLERLG